MTEQPKRRKRLKPVEVVGAFILCAGLAALLVPAAARSRLIAQNHSCQSNLKQIALGIKAYVRDYDEKFPLSTGNTYKGDAGYGWAGSVQPYLKSISILQCPAETTTISYNTSTATADFTDYFYNPHLSNVSEASLNYISNTIMNGDGVSSNGSYIYKPTKTPPDDLPAATRHRAGQLLDGGANYAFADGHVKWLKPHAVSNDWAHAAIFTFQFHDRPPSPAPAPAPPPTPIPTPVKRVKQLAPSAVGGSLPPRR